MSYFVSSFGSTLSDPAPNPQEKIFNSRSTRATLVSSVQIVSVRLICMLWPCGQIVFRQLSRHVRHDQILKNSLACAFSFRAQAHQVTYSKRACQPSLGVATASPVCLSLLKTCQSFSPEYRWYDKPGRSFCALSSVHLFRELFVSSSRATCPKWELIASPLQSSFPSPDTTLFGSPCSRFRSSSYMVARFAGQDMPDW